MLDTNEDIKKPDLHFVDPKDHTEVEYLHSMYPWLSESAIKSAIEKHGPERKHIEDFLSGLNA
ncbi:MAG: hypothetical protein ABJB11_21525 [Ferruginibacter sp.]